jgi:dTDP-4-amino-4,6-dideoxygalactose transaminase
MPIWELLFSLAFHFATVPWLYGRLTLPRLLAAHATERPTLPEDDVSTSLRTSYYRREFDPLQARLVLRAYNRLPHIREHIAQLVQTYVHGLEGSTIATFLPGKYDAGALLRFPIAFPTQDRATVLRLALRRGLYLETNYEVPLPDPSEQAQFPNALWAAKNLLLLPLYRAFSREQARRLVVQLREIEVELAERKDLGSIRHPCVSTSDLPIGAQGE